MSTVLVSGASERYGYWLLNLIGSVHANARGDVDRIVVFDLGLNAWQRRLARGVRGVELRRVPPFVPHWREGRTWKTWIWAHLEAERLLWLDAGMTVLQSLRPALAQIDERGYFVVSQGVPVADSVPSDYYERFGFPRELGQRVSIAAGIVGFARGSHFDERVVVPTYEAALAGFSIGFSPGEAEKLNIGLDRTPSPLIRDCPLFRHEQTLLNIHFYRAFDQPVVNDLDRFAGWRSRHDHPAQVVWSHRRRGDYSYLTRVPFQPRTRPLGLLFGLAFRARWWYLHHRWLLRPSTYVHKARRLLAGPSRR